MAEPGLEKPSIIPRDDFRARVDLVRKLLENTEGQYKNIETYLNEEQAKGKIENFVGAVPIPVGLCGPIDIAGEYAMGAFIVPMATLEGTLVASYSRGAKVMNRSGGCETRVYGDSFLRAVQFSTSSLARSMQLIDWCRNHEPEVLRLVNESSAYISVKELSYDCVGSTVVVSIRAETGDAMGSNMVSKAAGVLYDYVAAHAGLIDDASVPHPEDKKYIPQRQKGKKVIARTILQREAVTKITRTSLEKLADFITNYKNLLAYHGAYSLNIHVANGMAALFQAFGQDVAYLAECSQAIVDCHFKGPDRLEVSLTLPTLIIGTVGGGTGLPAFQTTLSMVDCCGAGKARKLAEIMAAVILAGEIGCAAAQCAREFVRAHETLGKNRPNGNPP
jgi:hydroxymethylglutaryl-CoA reductase (NADPH)